MNKQQRLKELKKLAKSPQGKALKEFLEEKITEMNDMTTVESWEETLGRKIAIKSFKNIMRKLDLLKEDIPKITKEDYS